jgi:hypothetical protein
MRLAAIYLADRLWISDIDTFVLEGNCDIDRLPFSAVIPVFASLRALNFGSLSPANTPILGGIIVGVPLRVKGGINIKSFGQFKDVPVWSVGLIERFSARLLNDGAKRFAPYVGEAMGCGTGNR